MTARLDRAANEATARWLCHGCGERHPLDGPAYPICAACGQRCRMVDAEGLPFVGSPEDRLEAVRAAHEKAYAEWRGHLNRLRELVDRLPAEPQPWELERFEGARPIWRFLVSHAPYVNHTAEHLDRVEAEIARMRGEA